MEAMTKKLLEHGADVLCSRKMEAEKAFVQHGKISCYEHSLSVAKMSLMIAMLIKVKTDERALVRGALLHDYFLYDWHINDGTHKLHGFRHAETALLNAKKDFELSPIEEDIIKKHMFPLNIMPPSYRESWIVCAADKICALRETVIRK